MKKFVKYIGDKNLIGNYFTTGLIENNFYEFVKTTDTKQFIFVINEFNEEFAYFIGLFQ